MAKKPYDLAVFIGRFQPFHRGHLDIVRHAAKSADSVLVLVGSAYRPRSWKNPFTYSERKSFIELCATHAAEEENARLVVLPLIDSLYNDRAWTANVRTAIRTALSKLGVRAHGARVVLTGFEKDSTSAYLRWFPDLDHDFAPAREHDGVVLNATDLREHLFFGCGYGEHFTSLADKDVRDVAFLSRVFGADEVNAAALWMHANPVAVEQIREEAVFVKGYRARIAKAEAVFGHPIQINAADAIVVQSGHVLLVTRGAAPGKGLLALPGGHIDPGETALQASIRELYEECRLDAPKGAISGRLKARQVFDHPNRSERGWVRTEAFLYELEDRARLEKIRAGSDASAAEWIPISDITPDRMFEDHFDILHAMIKDIPFAYPSLLMAS